MEEIRRLIRGIARVMAERRMAFPAQEALVVRGWVLVRLDPARMPGLAAYRHPDLLAHLKAVLGRPVYALTDPGFWYAIPLVPRQGLPAHLPFPGLRPGTLRLGMGPRGEVALTVARPEGIGHGFVVGQSQFGKSNLLRLIAAQGLALGMQLHVLDPRGQLLAGLQHPALRRWSAEEFPDLLRVLESEMRERDRLLAAAGAENLAVLNRQRTAQGEPPLPRWLVLLDELEAILEAGPGIGERSRRRRQLAGILWHVLKDGIHIVAAAHEPTREELGSLLKAFRWRISFRLLTPAISRAFLGTDLAARLRRPGQCYSPELGPFQAYWLPPEQVGALVNSTDGWLSPQEREILARTVGPEGRFSLRELMEAGMPERAARALQQRLRELGAAYKDPQDHNVHRLVPELLEQLRRTSSDSNPIAKIAAGRLTEIGLPV